MKNLITVLLLFASFGTFAQSLSGNLRSESKSKALGYGNVDIYQEDVLIASILTDSYGNFNVALDTGMYECVINYAGHLPIKKSVHVLDDEKNDFSMMADPERKILETESAEAMGRMVATDLVGATITSEDIEHAPLSDGISVRGSRAPGGEGTYSWSTPDTDALPLVGGEMDELSDFESDNRARSGTLTAGEVNDFSKWDMWEDLTKAELKAHAGSWKIAPTGRYTVVLQGQTGLPLADASVKLMSKNDVVYSARTDNTGKAELWLSIEEYVISRSDLSMEIDYMGTKQTLRRVKPFSESINYCTMEVPCYELNNVDIAFVVDATGSMADELSYLKAELNDVIFKTKQISSKLNFHFANVFYRDQGDEYVTKSMDFSRVLSESVEFISHQQAGGGGDYEEGVEFALDTAINSLSWNENARARIIFLILDAPPHNTAENRKKMAELTRQAAEKGIRIVPVGASGINKSTEYLLRTLAIGTNGTYTFLTDHSGVGNGHIAPSTDKFKVETFNDLMVRILKSYTYMPDCNQNLPDLELDYPDSLVSIENPIDTTAIRDSSDVVDHHHTNPFPEISWSFYPNPTTGILNITADSDIEELFLTDLSGKLMKSIKNLAKDRVYQMDLTELTTGIYLIRYLHKDRWISGKVMLQR
ncbi:MAG: VWA domain-containing protein [Crocinitomicaceae bacterium]|nr:VWA domain-containing protein [Crocinitomicaceae bacterium]